MNDEHESVALDYSSKIARIRRRVLPIFLVITICIAFSLVLLILSPYQERGCKTNKCLCSVNLRHIGQAIYVYHGDKAGNDADFAAIARNSKVSLDELIAVGLISNRTKICNYFDGEGVCYKRVKSSTWMNGAIPIFVENPNNHPGGGGHVLFDDGHVEWFKPDELDVLIQSATFNYEAKATGE